MPPRFHGDAIELSGETGTKLKSEIIGEYYPLWWSITSGGESRGHPYDTSIVELNAGTGLDYIADIGKTILGSSGHALKLKGADPKTRALKVVLFEDDRECFGHLRKVVRRRWPSIRWSEDPSTDKKMVYLINADLTSALSILDQIRLGNSLYFFDPLLFTPWVQIDSVARKRIKLYYETRTEFIVFLFTSDWFYGRKGLIAPLPKTNDGKWSAQERDAVEKCDQLFGRAAWRAKLLNDRAPEERIRRLVELYRDRLHTWFRYVLPLPFDPKTGQTYHLFMCSNYEDGVEITKGFYADYTGNDQYSP
ncbi:MAG: three-Cys-motif partner protein TcmP, partial [Nitrososphaera sp.]